MTVDDVTVNIATMQCGYLYLAISAIVINRDVMSTILSPLLCPTAFDPSIPVILMKIPCWRAHVRHVMVTV